MQQKQAMRSLSVYKAMLNERGNPTARVSVNDVGNYTLAEQFARFLSDDDIVCYAKQIEDDPCIDWYFDRSSRHKPFWKSEAEFKAVFRSRLSGQYDKFVTRFKSLEKHLVETTGRPVIDEEAIGAVGGYIEKIQTEVDGAIESVAQEYRCSIRRYKQSLEIMGLLKQFVAALGADVRLSFTILSVSDFNSGFVPGKLEATKVHIPERELPSALKDIVSLPQISKSNSAFFYLYSDEKSKIDLALLEEKLLDYAFKL